jgi:ElaB/YqjD/DUF883 family membrane-anchored ribosome-binding protein
MKTIEQLLETIEELNDLAATALDLVDEWGGESEKAEELRERLELILDEHRKLN